jgi:hypothetical protein
MAVGRLRAGRYREEPKLARRGSRRCWRVLRTMSPAGGLAVTARDDLRTTNVCQTRLRARVLGVLIEEMSC